MRARSLRRIWEQTGRHRGLTEGCGGVEVTRKVDGFLSRVLDRGEGTEARQWETGKEEDSRQESTRPRIRGSADGIARKGCILEIL